MALRNAGQERAKKCGTFRANTPWYLLRTGIKNIAPSALIWLHLGVFDPADGQKSGLS
jgi:hypothetical protein